MAGIYIHIPYCAKKCIYCDFYSVGARKAPWADYVSAIVNELHVRIGELRGEKVTTIYIGGGTPSLMPHAHFRRLAAALCDVAPEVEEFTVEVNPDDVSAGLVDLYKECGVGRVSMGVQSFDDAELKRVGRRHTSMQAREAYALLRGIGNVSIDLIFGLPGQTPESWESSLAQAIALRPEHISAYSLMWEEGTPLTLMRRQGRLEESPEGWSLAMYSTLTDALEKAGYVHYEISNYSLPGRESRHNSSYWKGTPYLGLGAGAHSYDGRRLRRSNPCDAAAYTLHYNRDINPGPFFITEELSREEIREEYVMTRLRTAAGIDMEEYLRLFGRAALAQLLASARPHLRSGYLSECGSHISLSRDAVMMLDSVTVDLL